MQSLLLALAHFLCTAFRRRLALQLEVVALRHQLSIYERSRPRRFRIEPGDRVLWSWLARLWPAWRQGLRFVQTRTVLQWQKRRSREHWRRKSENSRPGRPPIDPELRELIRRISRANLTWGSPRLVGELAKLGIVVAKSTVEKYRIRATGAPSPTWKAFLDNYVKDLVSIDFFVVPTMRFKIFYVLVVLAHDRRRIVHFNATANPTAQWTAQQMVEAFPFDTAPRYLIRDRDGIYGEDSVKLHTDLRQCDDVQTTEPDVTVTRIFADHSRPEHCSRSYCRPWGEWGFESAGNHRTQNDGSCRRGSHPTSKVATIHIDGLTDQHSDFCQDVLQNFLRSWFNKTNAARVVVYHLDLMTEYNAVGFGPYESHFETMASYPTGDWRDECQFDLSIERFGR